MRNILFRLTVDILDRALVLALVAHGHLYFGALIIRIILEV